MTKYLAPIDYQRLDFGDFFDELPLWSAPFGIQLLDRVPLRSHSRILDIGAGTGFLSLELSQRCGPNSQLFAVDPWPSAIQRLRKKIEYFGIENVIALQESAERVSLLDATIDLAVCNLGINNFENPTAVLHETYRVCQPGATLIVTTNLVGHMAEFYAVFRRTLERVFPGECIEELETHIAHRGTAEEVTGLISNAGFNLTNSEVSEYRMRFCNGTALLNHFFIRLGFLGGWRGVVGPDRESQFFQELEKDLNAYSETHGELSLTIPVAYIEARKP